MTKEESPAPSTDNSKWFEDEEEIMPGVYFLRRAPRPANSTNSSAASSVLSAPPTITSASTAALSSSQKSAFMQYQTSLQNLPVESVYGELDALVNSIKHLWRSNEEMKRFIAESSDTSNDEIVEFHEFIRENEAVVVNNKVKVKICEKRLMEIGVKLDSASMLDTLKEPQAGENLAHTEIEKNAMIEAEKMAESSHVLTQEVDEEEGVFL
ncbi:hypothetical protein BKA69DRAFT_1062062 [Paraphysoderma sedebokerense]|nr:hypothetical protein BKA69DRAFT_1062062 [Paraphysoderma sedebokerense]